VPFSKAVTHTERHIYSYIYIYIYIYTYIHMCYVCNWTQQTSVENEKLSKQTLQTTWRRSPLGYDASESVQIYKLREKACYFQLRGRKKNYACVSVLHTSTCSSNPNMEAARSIKGQQISIRLHGVTLQNTAVCIAIAVWTSNLALMCKPSAQLFYL
jgi:hypothetical protein